MSKNLNFERSPLYLDYTEKLFEQTSATRRSQRLKLANHALADYFAPKHEVQDFFSKDRGSLTAADKFSLNHLAINAFCTEVSRLRIVGDKRAKSLASLNAEIAGRNYLQVLQEYTGFRSNVLDLEGEPADIALKAARLQAIATRDLAILATKSTVLSPINSSSLVYASDHLTATSSQARLVQFYGVNGKNEVLSAVKQAIEIKLPRPSSVMAVKTGFH